MSKKRIVVIGGGPAGLMAAGQAATCGVGTLLLEKKKRPARKLCITGKGRCNITNIAELEDFIAHFGETRGWLRPAFSRFFNADLMDFLETRGLKLQKERDGRVFPVSGKAQDVLAVFMQWIADLDDVYLKYSTPVNEILVDGDGRVSGVVSKGRKYPCGAVVLATGGASYPGTGSTGDGYQLAADLGHDIVPIRPALVPLRIEAETSKILDGVSLRNTNVSLFFDGELQREAFGEVAFTRKSLAGPVMLTMSGQIVDALDAKRKVAISIDLKPALSKEKLNARILRDLAKRGGDPFKSFMRGLLPRQVVSICQLQTRISGKRLAKTITPTERKRLVTWLKGFRLRVTGYRPITEAIVTAGGIATNEIDPETLESRLVPGLFVAGEVIDVDADTGGYNLQAAFSTGWLAGRSAGEYSGCLKGLAAAEAFE